MIKVALNKQLNAPNGLMRLQVNFEIESGNFVTIYGKSGAGKTSILRMLAGLMMPEEGKIMVEEQTWLDTNKRINLSPQKRKVGFVFQDYALFPNMTVQENLTFALLPQQDKKIIKDLIEIIELGDLKNRKPTTLSGGQKQRLALARALVQRPSILMLDEPLSALDYEMRLKLQKYILQVHKEYGHTSILISHDIDEVINLSDKVLILENGQITHQGAPNLLLKHLRSDHLLELTGEVISIEKSQSVYTLKIKTDNSIHSFLIDEKTANTIKELDKIKLSLNFSKNR